MLTWCTPGRTSFGLLTVSHSTGAVMYVSLSVVMLTRLRYFLSVLQVCLPSYNCNSTLLLLLLFQPTHFRYFLSVLRRRRRGPSGSPST